jgi:hypothetical protein
VGLCVHVSSPVYRTNYYIKIVDKSVKKVAKVKYLGTTAENKNCIHKEIKSRLKFGESLLPCSSETSVFTPPIFLDSNIQNTVTFEVFMAVKMLLFWVVNPCGLVGRYQRFGET